MANEPDETPAHLHGPREHIRETLQRVRAAIVASRGLTAQSREALARSEVLADTSARALHLSRALQGQLRASVAAYVRQLKSEGLPSERMLIEVKAAVREATPPELDVVEARELMEDVVRWSVEAYYQVG
jgi:hypothetical protein